MISSSDKRLAIFLAASLLIHAGLIKYLSVEPEVLKPASKQIEVTYKSVKAVKKKKPEKKMKQLKIEKQKKLKKKVDVLERKIDVPPSLDKKQFDMPKLSETLKLDKKFIPTIKPLNVNDKVSVSMVKSEKISNTDYIRYMHKIRERISQRAYSYINPSNIVMGEVRVTFVISSDGQLVDLKIIEEDTNANAFLRDVGTRSVRESAPFPRFPKELSYPELSVSVIITFQLKD